MLCVPRPLRAADLAHQRRLTVPTRARDGEGQRGWGLGFTVPVGWISAGRRYMSTDPVRPGLVAPEAEAALPDAAAPTRLTKRGHYRWSARWAGQGRLPFAPKTGKRPGWVAEINHEI